MTFDPTLPRVLAPGRIVVAHDHDLKSVSCPTTTACTAIDNGGYEVTFDPRTGAANAAGTVLIGPGDSLSSAVTCPSVRQCTLVDKDGGEATFDPLTGRTISSAPSLADPPADSLHSVQNPLYAVACPSTSQCTAVGTVEYGAQGVEVTFDPQTPGTMTSTPTSLTTKSPLHAVSCPSLHDCTAVGDGASAVTFDPITAPASDPVAARLPGRRTLTGLVCGTGSRCLATAADGAVISFDPAVAAGARRSVAPGARRLDALACHGPVCVAVDSAGRAFVGGTVGRSRHGRSRALGRR